MVISRLMRAMITKAITANTAEAMKSLSVIIASVTPSVSSRKRLIASPGESGRARAPGSARMRREQVLLQQAPGEHEGGIGELAAGQEGDAPQRRHHQQGHQPQQVAPGAAASPSKKPWAHDSPAPARRQTPG